MCNTKLIVTNDLLQIVYLWLIPIDCFATESLFDKCINLCQLYCSSFQAVIHLRNVLSD